MSLHWCLHLLEMSVILTAAVLYLRQHHEPRKVLRSTGKSPWYSFRDDAAPLWCGKAYQPEWPAVDPGGRVTRPKESPTTILDFRCYTRMNAYFHGEKEAEVIFEFSPTTSLFPRAENDQFHVQFDPTGQNQLLLSVGSQQRRIIAPSSETIVSISLDLEELAYSFDATQLRCHVRQAADILPAITRYTDLYYLPPREHSIGSFSKIDRISGAILLNSTTKGESLSDWTPFYPYGYYGTPSNLTDLVTSGFNIIHAIPDLPGTDNYGYGHDYAQVLVEAAELGLWVMHDMRWTWQNLSLLSIQLQKMKTVPNLLTWYSGDEPDGTTDDPVLFQASTKLIREIDSRYHVVSAVYNCADFRFEEYTHDIDIIMTDPYPAGLVSTSTGHSVYGTVCNSTYGCCGCDNCQGSVQDVTSRIESYKEFLAIYDRNSPLWLVPQGFGGELHWDRFPTAVEESAMQLLGINHGVMGIVAWSYRDGDDRYDETRNVTSKLARMMTSVSDLLIFGNKTMVSCGPGIDISLWENTTHALITYVNDSESKVDCRVHLARKLTSDTKINHEIGMAECSVLGDGLLIVQSSQDLAADVFLLSF